MKRTSPFKPTFLAVLVPLWTAFAQIPEAELRPKVNAAQYGALAESARLQGDVHLAVEAGQVTVISGHPLLAQAAVENAKSFATPDRTLEMTYHFALIETVSVPAPVVVNRGNAFERAILRLFGRKTQKVVLENRCQQGTAPPNDLKVSVSAVEVWIYGRSRCLMTVTTDLVAQR